MTLSRSLHFHGVFRKCAHLKDDVRIDEYADDCIVRTDTYARIFEIWSVDWLVRSVT